MFKWLSHHISWKIKSSLKCHHSLKISFGWSLRNNLLNMLVTLSCKQIKIYIFSRFFVSFSWFFFLSSKNENCLVKRSIVIIIIFILYKLATMSPFGWHPPHLVDNTDTLYLGDQIDNRQCWFFKIFLCFCVQQFAFMSVSFFRFCAIYSQVF